MRSQFSTMLFVLAALWHQPNTSLADDGAASQSVRVQHVQCSNCPDQLVPWEAGLTLQKAINRAGGSIGFEHAVTIVNKAGRKTILLKNLFRPDAPIFLQPGDVVEIGEKVSRVKF
jgi:hypothetical protein